MERFVFEPLGDHHDRASFTCSGEEGHILQEYFRSDHRLMREHRRHVTTAHVLVEASNRSNVAGFFTLSTATVEIEELPKSATRGLPLYRPMPALKLGRMAVDDRFRGRNIGTTLIEEVLRICLALSESVGFIALLVDAKTEQLVSYYEERGFSRFLDEGQKLYIMRPTIAEILSA